MKKISTFISIPIIVISILVLIDISYSGPEWSAKDLKILGTTVRIQVNHIKRSTRELAIKKVIEEFERIESKFSPFKKDSELSIINAKAFKEDIKISDEMAELLNFSLDVTRQTEGAFDITYASIGHLYNFRTKSKPKDKVISKAIPGIGISNIVLDENNIIRFKHPETQISFGGFAKGYAVKRGIDIIKGFGIENALVTAGGDSIVTGLKNGQKWKTGIQAPRGKPHAVYTFDLFNMAISTSGDYERYFVDNTGGRIHHIFNPDTGKSVSDVQSVTVIGKDPMFTDALSTAIFVLGIKKGIALAENLKGIETLIIDNSGDLHKSTGFPKHIDFTQKTQQ